MKHQNKNKTKISSVLAISPGANAEGPFKAIRVARTSRGFKILFNTIASGEQTTVSDFLSDVVSAHAKRSVSHPTVLGMDSSAVSFYRIAIPPVKPAQAKSIIAMQAESLLPLPMERMKLGYRIDAAKDGKCPVTLAAGRADSIDRQLEMARTISAEVVILDAQAIVAAWRHLFAVRHNNSVVVHIRQKKSLVVRVESFKLCHAATIDVGFSDLCSDDTASSSAALFRQDLRNALDMFGVDTYENVFVLSPEQNTYAALIETLNAADIRAAASVPVPEKFSPTTTLETDDIIEYIEPLGTAFTVLDDEVEHIDIVGQVCNDEKTQNKTASFEKLIHACITLVLVLAMFLAVAKAVDKANLARIPIDDVSEVIAQRKVRKLVAQKRIDLVEVMATVETALPGGMKIGNLSCERGKPMSVSSTASSIDQILQFQDNLLKELKERQTAEPMVDFTASKLDEKKKTMNFKMTFNYKEYTKKSSRL